MFFLTQISQNIFPDADQAFSERKYQTTMGIFSVGYYPTYKSF